MTETTGRRFLLLPPGAAHLGYAFARPRAVAAACVIVLVSLGWLCLAALSARSVSVPTGAWPGLWRALCQALPEVSWSVSSFAIIVSMWCAMTVAMMLPSAAPMILTYADIAETAAQKGEWIVSPLMLAGGYASVWFGFSAVAATAQIALAKAALIDLGASSISGIFSGVIFLGAGIYQFSALKHACLTRCRHPFLFFFHELEHHQMRCIPSWS